MPASCHECTCTQCCVEHQNSIETSLLRYFNSRFLNTTNEFRSKSRIQFSFYFVPFFSALLHFSCFILSVSKIESYVPSWLIKKRSHFMRRSHSIKSQRKMTAKKTAQRDESHKRLPSWVIAGKMNAFLLVTIPSCA